jgi:hypothetical protein
MILEDFIEKLNNIEKKLITHTVYVILHISACVGILL